MDYTQIILDQSVSKDDRIQAAFQLENIGDDRAIRTLGKALFTDPSPIVRHECAFALGETAAAKEAGPLLMKAIETDESPYVRHEALMALGTLGDVAFIPFIEQFLTDDDTDVAESAEIALQRLRKE